MALTKAHNRMIEGAALNAVDFGVVDDGTTDNTAIIEDAIKEIFNSGRGTVGTDYVAGNLTIPPNVKWNYGDIVNKHNLTASAGTATTVTLPSSFTTDELIGCFLWNVTDTSYGIVISNTATVVTVRELLVGNTNTFSNGDNIIISTHRVGVNIIDSSKYDYHRDAFTAQEKVYLNCDKPSSTSANEFHISGQYHPGLIIENHGPSEMEQRASVIFRSKDPVTDETDKFYQTGFNGTQNEFSPENIQYLLIGGNGSYSSELLGIATESNTDRRIGIGIKAQDGYSFYQRHWTTGDNKWAINSTGVTTTIEFQQGSNTKFTLKADNDGISGIGGHVDIQGIRVLTQKDNGLDMINTSEASGTSNADLPAASERFKVRVTRTNATHNIAVRIQSANSSDQIVGTTAAGQPVSSSAIGDSIELISDGVNKWYVVQSTGTWTYS